MRLHLRRWLVWSGLALVVLGLLCAGLIVLLRERPIAEPGHVTKATEPAHVVAATEPGHVTEATPPRQVTEPTGPGHVTEANFALIRKGASRDEVARLMGREHRSGWARSTSKDGRHVEEKVYYEEGQSPRRKQAVVTFEMSKFTVIDKEFLDEQTQPGHVLEATAPKQVAEATGPGTSPRFEAE